LITWHDSAGLLVYLVAWWNLLTLLGISGTELLTPR